VVLRVYEQLAGEPEGAGEESGAGAGVSRRRAAPCRHAGRAAWRADAWGVRWCGAARRLAAACVVGRSANHEKAETD
jgi:hypothetical protein